MRVYFAVVVCVFAISVSARAQKAPEAGYIFPAGGKPGTTIDVHLGGYDWTPDMDFYVRDPRIQITPTGPLGAILIPGPPYWYGAKGRIAALPLPREVSAKLVIPANMPPGPVYWQAANANGGSSLGVFVVGSSGQLEVVEDEKRQGAQLLPSLPVVVSGRVGKIEEVDRYRFVAAKDGPITCELMARRLGAKFLGMMEVRDGSGKLVAEAAGTNGSDPVLTLAARAGAEYVVSVNDVDFGGDRSFVYRLRVAPGPRVVGAIPVAGKRGETREVEFVGFGVATGSAKLESVKRQVVFPASGTAFDYRLETPWGSAQPFALLLSDLPESVANSSGAAPGDSSRTGPAWLTETMGITGVLDHADTEDRYYCIWKKGEVWSLAAEARRLGSPLDVSLAVIGPNGKELARNEDLPETTDAGLDFTVPADGMYEIVVSDTAGKSGSRAAIYRLVVSKPAPPDFALQLAAPRASAPIGGRADLAVKATRKGGFKGPIKLSVNGLPEGVNAHPALVIPAEKESAIVSLHTDRQMGVGAGFATIEGTSGGLTRTAQARTNVNLAPHHPDDTRVSAILVSRTLKPQFKGRPVDADTVRKVHRGTTFPAEVVVERFECFNGEIILQMVAQQSYQVHGITGGDVIVPPGVKRILYPCYMPEWLETTRTSRMGVFAVAKVRDPQGKERWLANDVTGFITMTLEGALLKLSAEEYDLAVEPGKSFDVHLKVSRLAKLAEPVRLELRLPEEQAGFFKAEPVVVPVGHETAVMRITPAAGLRGSQTCTIRGTAIQDGKYPVVSEATVPVEFVPVGKSPR